MIGTAAVLDLVRGADGGLSGAGVEQGACQRNPQAFAVVSASYRGYLHDRERYLA
jgi:hypothetical protein